MKHPRLFLLAALPYALAFFFWLGYEETNTLFVSLLGAGLSLLAASRWLPARLARASTPRRRMATWLLGGALTGLAASPLTVILMLVKISLHSHTAPDFDLPTVIATLKLTPVWGGAGMLLGAAGGLVGRPL